MKITRDGEEYQVVDETESEYCVEVFILYYPNQLKSQKLWWDKKDCEPVSTDQ
jgi:hypothetical protein